MSFMPSGVTGQFHSWMSGIRQMLEFVMAWFTETANAPVFIDLVMTKPLPANTYANGTSGVGATLTGNANGAFPTVDGVAPKVGALYLIVDEASSQNNGLYVLTTLGTSSTAYVLTRYTGFDQSAEIKPASKFFVKSGTVHGTHVWEFVGLPLPTVGTTVLPFAGTVRLAKMRGSVPASRLPYSANPANLDVFAIGGMTFKFVTALGAATTFVQIKVLGSAALSIAEAVNAINGIPSINWVEATTPFAVSVVGDAVTATQLRIRNADARGGFPAAASLTAATTTALTASITAGASGWTIADLSAYGKNASDTQMGTAIITITSAMITAGEIEIEFPFTPTAFSKEARGSTGISRATQEAFTISGNSIKAVLAGGSSPNLQNTDVLSVIAFQ